MQKAVNQHAEIINTIQKDVKYRATEETLSGYLNQISEGLHKDCGDRPHHLRVKDEHSDEQYQTEQSPVFKQSVYKLMGKMEVISAHLLKNAAVSIFE